MMTWNMPPETADSGTSALAAAAPSLKLDSLLDYVVAGGAFMYPIALCSVVALMYIVERWLRLRPRLLGTDRFGREVVAAVRTGGPAAGIEACEKRPSSLGRI